MLLITETKKNLNNQYESVNQELFLALMRTGQFVNASDTAPLAYSAEGFYARDKQLMKQHKKTFIIADYVSDSTIKLLRYTANYNEYMREFFMDTIAPQHATRQSLVKAWGGFKNKCLLTTKIILADKSSYIIRDWEDVNNLTARPSYCVPKDEEAKFHRRQELTTTWDSDLDIYRRKQAEYNKLDNRLIQLQPLFDASGITVTTRQMYFMLLEDERYFTKIKEYVKTYDPRLWSYVDEQDLTTIIMCYGQLKFDMLHDIPTDPIVVGLDARLYAERILEVQPQELDKYNTLTGDAVEWDTVGYQIYFGKPHPCKWNREQGGKAID